MVVGTPIAKPTGVFVKLDPEQVIEDERARLGDSAPGGTRHHTDPLAAPEDGASPSTPTRRPTTPLTPRHRRGPDRMSPHASGQRGLPDTLPDPLPIDVVDNHVHLDITREGDEPFDVAEAVAARPCGRCHAPRPGRLRPRGDPLHDGRHRAAYGRRRRNRLAPQRSSAARRRRTARGGLRRGRAVRGPRAHPRHRRDRPRLLPHGARGRAGPAGRLPLAHRPREATRQGPADPRPRRPRRRAAHPRRGGRPGAHGAALLLGRPDDGARVRRARLLPQLRGHRDLQERPRACATP